VTNQEYILIVDFGSQYTQLIARRIREFSIFSLIVPHYAAEEEILKNRPAGIILSGGPMSVYDEDAPDISTEIFSHGIAVLGICYGLQLLSKKLGGRVTRGEAAEYGRAHLQISDNNGLLDRIENDSQVWMSHGDLVEALPEGFICSGSTEHTEFAVAENWESRIYGVQFHPEVYHTTEGGKILSNFAFRVCQCKGDWNTGAFADEAVEKIKNEFPEGNAICAISGGVDSSVAAVLVSKALGKRLYCVHVDNGLMRLNESAKVLEALRDKLGLNLIFVDASDEFLKKLEGVESPEEKRKIIGRTFIEIFEREAKKIPDARYLVQGTLYPDVIESVSVKGKSVTIKSHHNVGGLPEKMHLKLIEPLRELFKDEVRALGRYLGIDEQLINRQPFPGPGLAVRVLGDITREKLDVLRAADDIYISEIKNAGIYNKIWQAFCVLLPVKSVGVMGDARTYENVLALRAVTSVDGMTADWYRFDHEFLARVSNLIINKVDGVNRVVYDISSKPPATIEWE